MIASLIAKLERVAETHPDPKIRAAALRDAQGYAAALAAKQTARQGREALAALQASGMPR